MSVPISEQVDKLLMLLNTDNDLSNTTEKSSSFVLKIIKIIFKCKCYSKVADKNIANMFNALSEEEKLGYLEFLANST